MPALCLFKLAGTKLLCRGGFILGENSICQFLSVFVRNCQFLSNLCRVLAIDAESQDGGSAREVLGLSTVLSKTPKPWHPES